MKALYEVIDKGQSSKSSLQGLSADEARSLTVELISKSPGDYSPKLKALMAEVAR